MIKLIEQIVWDIQTICFVSHSFCKVSDIFSFQQSNGIFDKYGIIIRLLAIENYYKKNNYGWDLYRKLRVKQLEGKNISIQDAELNFIKLIQSYEKNGHNADSEIFVDKNFRIVNGSHRMALALYFNVENIPCRIVHRKGNHLTKENLLSYGFSTYEVDIVYKRYIKLLKEVCT